MSTHDGCQSHSGQAEELMSYVYPLVAELRERFCIDHAHQILVMCLAAVSVARRPKSVPFQPEAVWPADLANDANRALFLSSVVYFQQLVLDRDAPDYAAAQAELDRICGKLQGEFMLQFEAARAKERGN